MHVIQRCLALCPSHGIRTSNAKLQYKPIPHGISAVICLAGMNQHTDGHELARLLDLSRAFKLSKAVNLAGKLDIVTKCAQSPDGLTLPELCTSLGWYHALDEQQAQPSGSHQDPGTGPRSGNATDQAWPVGVRGPADYVDLLVSLRLLHRQGEGRVARYLPHPDTARFLLHGSPDCITGILALNNDRSAPLFEYLEQGLRDGAVPEEARQRVPDIESTFSNQAGGTAAGGATHFALGMLGASIGNFRKLAQVFDFSRYQHVVDIGGSTGCCCVAICQSHEHMTGITCDLPAVHETAQRYVDQHGMTDRVKVMDLDFFSNEPFPESDVIIMGMVLHDWGLAKKKLLIQKARAALKPGGVFIAVENLVDDDRNKASAALASSLNMLLEFGRESAFDFSFKEFCRWTQEAGFTRMECIQLVGNSSAAVAYV